MDSKENKWIMCLTTFKEKTQTINTYMLKTDNDFVAIILQVDSLFWFLAVTFSSEKDEN